MINTQYAKDRRRFVIRMFLFICLLLVLIDMPLTIYIDGDYTNDLEQRDITNTTNIMYFFLEKPKLAKFQHENILRAIENERLSLSFSNKPLYLDQIKYLFCKPGTICHVSHYKIHSSLEELHIGVPHPFLKFSYYVAPSKVWLNFHFMKRSYPVIAVLLVMLELAIVFVSITYLISVYRFTRPWEKIRALSENLGLTMSRKSIPFFGPTIIKESVVLMEAMASKIDLLIQERVKTIASLSHDIRTPLTRAQFYLHEIEDKELAGHLQKQCDEIQFYLNETLSYAKQDYQDEPKRNLEIISLIDTICHEMQATKQPVVFHSEAPRFAIFGQRVGLMRAISNLITNGVKYGKSVDVYVKEELGGIKLTIDDHGPGLPEKMLKKVFEPFYRYYKDKEAKSSGTGLGLSIAKTIVENNNGTISLQNILPQGLRVIVYLWNNTERE
jgi:signal transduction histidine kinase